MSTQLLKQHLNHKFISIATSKLQFCYRTVSQFLRPSETSVCFPMVMTHRWRTTGWPRVTGGGEASEGSVWACKKCQRQQPAGGKARALLCVGRHLLIDSLVYKPVTLVNQHRICVGLRRASRSWGGGGEGRWKKCAKRTCGALQKEHQLWVGVGVGVGTSVLAFRRKCWNWFC